MTIKARFLIITVVIFLLTGGCSWLSMKVIAEGIIVKWAEIYAEKQLRYDQVRTLLPLIQEVNLSKEFAELTSLQQWAQQPENETLKQEALADAEAFRHRFSDNSYFIALRKNGHYFYGDSDAKERNLGPYRYTLDQKKPEDAWFFTLIDKQIDLHLNVNPDVELGVVKLWSDVLIRYEDEILGVVGTGLNLSSVLNRMVEEQDVYSAVIFTNSEGSIQLHQQERLINFSTISKQQKDKTTVFQLLDDESSVELLQESFELARAKPNSVEMAVVYKDGERHLTSVIYFSEIDWFQVNFIDLNAFLPWTEFSGLLVVFLVSLVSALIIVNLLISLMVTRPIEALDASIVAIKTEGYNPPQSYRHAGSEIKRLIAHYQKMSLSFLKHQEELEQKVIERTEKLNSLAHQDPLTDLYNRRGFEEVFDQYMQQWKDNQQAFSLLSVDVDKFKQVNDEHGHITGDQVLQQLAKHLTHRTGELGVVARWGGDEFLILLSQVDEQAAKRTFQQLINDSDSFVVHLQNKSLTIGFSIGQVRVGEDDTLETLYHKADKAMYKAKFSNKA